MAKNVEALHKWLYIKKYIYTIKYTCAKENAITRKLIVNACLECFKNGKV